MREQEIRAEIEALGIDAAPRIAARFERLKPAPWQKKLADWWCRIEWMSIAIFGILVGVFILGGCLVSSEAEGKRKMFRACESGDVDACETVRRDDRMTDYSRLRAERKLRELGEATK